LGEGGMMLRWEDRFVVHTDCLRRVRKRLRSLGSLERQLLKAALERLETYETVAEVARKAEEAAELVRDGNTVAFTGAGISVSCGIPDYRGTTGVDAREELGHAAGEDVGTPADGNEETETDYGALRPSRTHLLLADMERSGYLSYTISQNCDHLHRRAGTSPQKLTELHGNVFVEYCEDCWVEYERDYEVDLYSTNCYKEKWFVECDTCGHGHYTGRLCDECGGKLKDTIINFGDNLHARVLGGLDKAEEMSRRASCVLCLGSSLQVTPACTLPLMGGSLVVVNLQATALDRKSTVRVHAEADLFMSLLWEALRNPKQSATDLSAGGGRGREEAAEMLRDVSVSGRKRSTNSRAASGISGRTRSKRKKTM